MSVVSGGDVGPLHGDEPAVLARQTSLPWRVWPACGGDGDLGHLPVAAHPRARTCSVGGRALRPFSLRNS